MPGFIVDAIRGPGKDHKFAACVDQLGRGNLGPDFHPEVIEQVARGFQEFAERGLEKRLFMFFESVFDLAEKPSFSSMGKE